MNHAATADGAGDRAGSLPQGQRLRAQIRFGLAFILLLPGLALWLRSGLAVPPVTFLAGPLPVLIGFIATALFATIGLAITLRRPEVRTGRILAWVAVVQGFRDLAWGYAALAGSSTTSMPLDPALATELNYALTFPLVAAMLIMLIVIFPTDRPKTNAGWRVAGSALVGGALVIVGTLARPGRIAFVTTYTNPLGPEGLGPLAATIQLTGYAILVVTAVLAAMLVVSRYRHADEVTRVQLRVFVGATVFLAVMFALLIATSLADAGTRAARDLVAVALLIGTALVPLAVAAAVAHYRLYAIDRLVSRGFVYGLLVAILAGLTAASVQLFTALFKALTGETSDAVLVLTTLLLVSVITPIRTRLETVVKRLTRNPPIAEAAITVTGWTTDGVLMAPPAFADPSFVAALDARIRLVVGPRDADGLTNPIDRPPRRLASSRPMGAYTFTARIEAGPETVYDLFTDVHRMHEWTEGVSRVSDEVGPAGQVGSRYTVWFGRMRSPSTILEAERPYRYRTRFGNRLLRGQWAVTLEADGDGTLLTETFVTEGLLPAIMARLWATGSYRGSFKGELASFKRIAEREARERRTEQAT